MTPDISQFFTGPEVTAIAEFLRSPTGQRYTQYRQLSRPDINPGFNDVQSVALAASLAEGWESCIASDARFVSPATQEPESEAFPDLSTDLPGH